MEDGDDPGAAMAMAQLAASGIVSWGEDSPQVSRSSASPVLFRANGGACEDSRVRSWKSCRC